MRRLARAYRLQATIIVLIAAALPARAQDWVEAMPLPSARYDMAAVALDENIYVIGGRNRSHRPTASVQRYEPLHERWTEVADMDEERSEAAAVVLGGRIFVIGGADDDGEAMDDVEVFDPSHGEWEEVEELETERRGHQAVVLDGRIYVVGGVDEDGRLVKEIEVYDPDEDEWTVSDDWRLKNPRVAFALVAIGEDVYALGGLGGGNIFEPLQQSEVFSPGREPGEFVPPGLFRSRIARGFMAASVAGETAYLMGGMDQKGVRADVIRFEPSASNVSDKWAEAPRMRRARKSFAAVTVVGRLYAMGGVDEDNRVLASMESMVTNTSVERPVEPPGGLLRLEQNHPNPFTHSTTIAFVVEREAPAHVAVDVYDAAGRRVRTLVDRAASAGRHEVVWDGRTGDGVLAGSGTYFYVLRSNGRRITRMMTLIR